LISHDLAVVRQLAEEMIVMQHGRVVERGATDRVLDDPQEPYTRLLRDSVPRPGWSAPRRTTAVAT
jgi:oligopeptide transport system ATP-binding protein